MFPNFFTGLQMVVIIIILKSKHLLDRHKIHKLETLCLILSMLQIIKPRENYTEIILAVVYLLFSVHLLT